MECKYEDEQLCSITSKRCIAHLLKELKPYEFCPIFHEEKESGEAMGE